MEGAIEMIQSYHEIFLICDDENHDNAIGSRATKFTGKDEEECAAKARDYGWSLFETANMAFCPVCTG